jgi:hypothetical protein
VVTMADQGDDPKPLHRLRDGLATLHRKSGRLTLREIQRAANGRISHTTAGKILQCQALPTWGSLKEVIVALEGDVETFQALWEKAAEAQDASKGEPPAPAPIPVGVTGCGPAGPGEEGSPGPTSTDVDGGDPEPPPNNPGSTVNTVPPGHGSPPWRAGLIVALVVALGALIAGNLAYYWGRGGTVGRCGDVPVDGPMSSVWAAPDGNCYGFTDTADGQGGGDSAQAGFGRDTQIRHAQAQLYAGNQQQLHPGDLTVIWFGALTCTTYKLDGSCSGAQAIDSEFQQLQGIQLVQRAPGNAGAVHVVIANAGAQMSQAVPVAQRIIAKKAAFGRVVVIGGDESRDTTSTAISALVGAGIPVIAPTLTSDLTKAGEPFLPGEPGYLQLLRPNQDWANAMIGFIAAHTPAPAHRQVIIYHVPVAGDYYTESLARDLADAARANPVTAALGPQLVPALSQLPPSICLPQHSSAPPGNLPPAIVFADRRSDFPAFVSSITQMCGRAGPALLVGNDSVNRILVDDNARKSLDAPWPMAYFKAGDQCTELQTDATTTPGGPDAALLATARSTGAGCLPTAQLGPDVSLTWDAVVVALRVVTGLPSLAGALVQDAAVNTTNGPLAIASGHIVGNAVGRPLCVYSVSLPPGDATTVTDSVTAQPHPRDRSINYCNKIYHS